MQLGKSGGPSPSPRLVPGKGGVGLVYAARKGGGGAARKGWGRGWYMQLGKGGVGLVFAAREGWGQDWCHGRVGAGLLYAAREGWGQGWCGKGWGRGWCMQLGKGVCGRALGWGPFGSMHACSTRTGIDFLVPFCWVGYNYLSSTSH